MTRTLLASLLASAAFFTPAASAQEPFDLGTLIVSGGLTPIGAETYGRAATVLTGAQIAERGLTTVQDALRAVPGVAVSGAGGNFTSVRIRGGEADHTLVLIDGVAAAGGDGEYIFTGLETANIERIEVLRGPQSAFYGSNASAGVVNIVTRTGGEGVTYGGAIEVGSHGSTIASAFASVRGARGGASFSLSDLRDAGWDFSGDGGERDETERTTLIVKGDYLVTETVKLGFNLRHAEERYEYDATSFTATDGAGYVVDDPDLYSDRDEMTASVFGEHTFLGGRAVQRLSYERTENEQSYDGGDPTETEAEAVEYRLSYGIDAPVASAAHLVTLLVERKSDKSSTNPLYERETDSLALEYRGTLAGRLDLQVGARHDNNSVFDDATTWNLGASYRFPNGMRLHASAGTGIVNPSYFELFADAFGYTGNPDLQPERNESFDLGLEIPLLAGRGVIDVTYFNETLTDEITSVSTGPGAFSFENQTGESTREGIEIEGQFAATDMIDLRLSYTYLDAKNPDGSVEIRRPMHELGLGVTARTPDGRGAVAADLRHVANNWDARYFPPFGNAKLPDYTVVDLAGRYAVTETVDFTARVANLFDESYSDVWGYASRGRTLYVGLDARW